jgi:hypothetical protein
MTTLELIDKRLRYALDDVNNKRLASDKEAGLRFDLDQPLSGYLQLNDRFVYHVRDGIRFEPLMTIEVTYKHNVYYFDVKGTAFSKDATDMVLYRTLKYPPGRDVEKRHETFWLATELDTPLDAIEGFMKERLA